MSESWNEICLGSYLVELPKSLLPAAHADESGAYTFFCSSSDPKKSHSWLLDQAAILLGTGGVATVHYGSGRYGYSTDTWAIRVRESEALTQEYAFRILEHSLARIDYAGFEGSGLRHLRKAYIKGLCFRVPGKRQQRRISAILDGIDAAIEKAEALIEKYQQVKAGLMHDLFTRGVLPNDQLRPPREQAPELYQETAIGWIPAEWKIGSLGEFADVHNSLRKPIASEIRERMKGAYPYYGPTGILDYINEFLVEGEYCLIGEDGDHFLKFQEWPMTQLVSGRFNVNNHAHLISGKNGASTLWLHHFFKHRDITFHLTRQGAGRYKLNKAALLQLPVAVPAEGEQTELASRLAYVEGYVESERRALRKLRNEKLGLMQALLTGKVPVMVDTPAPEPALG